jgi:hypothetical protein
LEHKITQGYSMKKLRALPLLLFALFHAQGQKALGSDYWLLPDNVRATTSEAEKQHFVQLIESVLSAFQPAAAKHNAVLSYEVNWNSSGAGAFTLRRNGGRDWHILFYDGLIRLPYVTDDLVQMIACHEVGHHIGGYPFKENGWAAAEGQADYFSTHACLPKLWQTEQQKNSTFRDRVNPSIRSWCEAAFPTQERRDICFRTGFAMEAARLYEGNGNPNSPRFDTPDSSMVTETFLMHPAAQCRLDTEIAGMLCNLPFDMFHIPGLGVTGQNTLDAERDSNRYICNSSPAADPRIQGNRPRCWFASLGAIDND